MSEAKIIFRKSLKGPSMFVELLEVEETATERGFLGESLYFGEIDFGGRRLVVSRAGDESDWTAIVSQEFLDQFDAWKRSDKERNAKIKLDAWVKGEKRPDLNRYLIKGW